MRVHAGGVDHDQLARIHVAYVLDADQVEGTGFGGKGDHLASIRPRHAAHSQRAEATRIAGGIDRVGGDQHHRKGSLNAAQSIGDGFRHALLQGMSDQVQNDLAVAGGLKDGALPLEALADIGRVHQVAVMRQGNASLVALDADGLGVQQRRVAGGRIAGVADGQASGHTRQRFIIEDVGHQPHGFVEQNALPIRGGDPGGFLAAMLQSVQAQIGQGGGLGVAPDGDHAAFFPKLVRLAVEHQAPTFQIFDFRFKISRFQREKDIQAHPQLST